MNKMIFQAYSSEQDMTFILEEVYKDDILVSTEVKGFYYGEPDEDGKQQFYGKLKSDHQ